ncbi:MAG: FecR domain-containing protein [Spirochaetes bacterium]|nr:FecR domain-containing protein [Spirochaetota bacterium]
MKKVILSLLVAAVFAASVFAQGAVFKEVSGKVEYQLPGKEWRPAKAGLSLPVDAVVSTGFKSFATVTLGSSLVTIKPLTRLTFKEIVQREGSESSKLYLTAGRIRAEVNTASGQKVDFTVQSPTATASVRGCTIEFDCVNLSVIDGIVVYTNSTGQSRTVSQDESTSLGSDGEVEVPSQVQELAATAGGVSDFDFGSGDSGGGIAPPVVLPVATISIIID